MIALQVLGCTLILLVQIAMNPDYSPSWLDYNGSYFNSFYKRPYTRIYTYALGVVFGSNYYSLKYESEAVQDKSKICKLMKLVRDNF